MDILRPVEGSTARSSSAVTILVVSQCETLKRNIENATGDVASTRIQTVPSVLGAYPALHNPRLGLIVVHLATPQDAFDAGRLLRAVAVLDRPVSVVAVGESGQAENGLTLLRQGALNYLERPLDLARLETLIDVLTVRTRFLAAEEDWLGVPSAHDASEGNFLDSEGTFLYSTTAALGLVMNQVRRVAPVDTTVLLQGETGTGKTRLARVIHDLSPRRDGPFLAVNCAALSATLIESELFGHVKGAFTGADRDRVGKFAAAAGGTLLLDEIDSLPPELQAKLLRVVEDRVFEPVGSNGAQRMQARLVAASNKPLGREVEHHRFRSDLYFRLNVVAFQMPPLREQPQVFPAMVEQFLTEFAARAGRAITGLTPDAMAALRAYPWPGNVRELRNAIERAVALRPDGAIGLDDLPDPVRAHAIAAAPVEPCRTASLTKTKEAAELSRIVTALQRNNNNRLRAAAELGISRMTLYKKLHRYGLMEPIV